MRKRIEEMTCSELENLEYKTRIDDDRRLNKIYSAKFEKNC